MALDPIDRLLAENEIRNLVGRIAQLADDGDLEVYLQLFTADATWANGDAIAHTGHEDLLAGAQQRRSDGIQGPGTGTRHLNTTLWVDVEGPDDAYAESTFLVLDASGDGDVVVRMTGRYEDRFRRTPDGWKLASRRIVTDVN